jgi:hypothetical protein
MGSAIRPVETTGRFYSVVSPQSAFFSFWFGSSLIWEAIYLLSGSRTERLLVELGHAVVDQDG